jgi:hypothetical protein
MKVLKIVWVVLIFTSLFNNICSAEDCLALIPGKAREVIAGFHDWKVVSLADHSEDDQKLWTASHKGQCPGIAAGRFVGEDRISYAAALIRVQPSGGLQEQLIVLSPDGDSFSPAVVVKQSIVTSPFVTWKASPGTYKNIDLSKTIQIARDSFIYEKIEAYAKQYYYVDGHLRSIVTAD